MKKLKELEEAEQILSETDMQDLIEPATSLTNNQTEMKALLGKKYVLVNYQKGYLPSKTYMCVYDGSKYVWKLINYTEEDALAAPSNVWAKSTRDVTTGRATVYLHWNDPEDTDTAHWHYSVVVKKKGSAPTSLYDGEVVGYSSIRNQYSLGTGFVDSLDIDTVDDRDILDSTIIPVADSERYWYKVFAVTRYGKISGSDAFIGELTWSKLQELTRAGIADHAISIGDVVQVVHDSLGVIDFQVVAFDNAEFIDASIKHSITFMSCDVLFRGSFDHQEEAYAPTVDTVWGSKAYYEYSTGFGKWVEINKSAYANPVVYQSSTGKPAYERNPCWISEESNASVYGRNAWVESNIRAWLNSRSTEVNWFAAAEKYHIWETYDYTVDEHGSYGVPAIDTAERKLFTGFYIGLEKELRDVMQKSVVKTTQPRWRRDNPDVIDVERSEDYVFLPSYTELFGENDKAFPADVSRQEGKQFDIYKNNIANTRMKIVLEKYNTTTAGQKDPNDNLASWYMRTPVRMKMFDPGKGETWTTDHEVYCVEIVASTHRQYDNIISLGEDGGTGRQAYMPAKATVSTDASDIPRDVRKNYFTPVGTTEEYVNNTSPGFVPCFVIG